MYVLRHKSILQKQIYCSKTRAVIFTPSSINSHTRPTSTTNTTLIKRYFSSHTNESTMHHILIVGGGPAGSSTAFFLAKAGFRVTVIERSNIPPYGQGIDITGPAVEIVKKMGLLEEIKASTTGESGFAMLDDAGKEIGTVGTNSADQKKMAFSPTNEIEVCGKHLLEGIVTD
jgi:pyruvate/2-oxoglutarate dehydrogenase complex dihydrolipoamide dehydrogenase (E3) component